MEKEVKINEYVKVKKPNQTFIKSIIETKKNKIKEKQITPVKKLEIINELPNNSIINKSVIQKSTFTKIRPFTATNKMMINGFSNIPQINPEKVRKFIKKSNFINQEVYLKIDSKYTPNNDTSINGKSKRLNNVSNSNSQSLKNNIISEFTSLSKSLNKNFNNSKFVSLKKNQFRPITATQNNKNKKEFSNLITCLETDGIYKEKKLFDKEKNLCEILQPLAYKQKKTPSERIDYFKNECKLLIECTGDNKNDNFRLLSNKFEFSKTNIKNIILEISKASKTFLYKYTNIQIDMTIKDNKYQFFIQYLYEKMLKLELCTTGKQTFCFLYSDYKIYSFIGCCLFSNFDDKNLFKNILYNLKICSRKALNESISNIKLESFLQFFIEENKVEVNNNLNPLAMNIQSLINQNIINKLKQNKKKVDYIKIINPNYCSEFFDIKKSSIIEISNCFTKYKTSFNKENSKKISEFIINETIFCESNFECTLLIIEINFICLDFFQYVDLINNKNSLLVFINDICRSIYTKIVQTNSCNHDFEYKKLITKINKKPASLNNSSQSSVSSNENLNHKNHKSLISNISNGNENIEVNFIHESNECISNNLINNTPNKDNGTIFKTPRLKDEIDRTDVQIIDKNLSLINKANFTCPLYFFKSKLELLLKFNFFNEIKYMNFENKNEKLYSSFPPNIPNLQNNLIAQANFFPYNLNLRQKNALIFCFIKKKKVKELHNVLISKISEYFDYCKIESVTDQFYFKK